MTTPRSAMDPYAPRILNSLLGLPGDAPVNECTLSGPVLRATTDVIVAIGAPEGTIDLPLWEAFPVRNGEELDLRKLRKSSRVYFAARPLDCGVPFRRLRQESPLWPRKLNRIELAWQDNGIRLEAQTLRVLPASDRRGIRCQGHEKIAGGREISPEPMTYGAIQLPPSGVPLIIGPDGPQTGGYLRIATVCFTSLRDLAWLLPGDSIEFTTIGREKALKQASRLEDALAHDMVPC